MQENKDFANEIIKHFGEDRFYHSCVYSSSLKETKKIFHWLNGPDANFESKCQEFLLNLIIKKEEIDWSVKHTCSLNLPMSAEEARNNMCRILYGICEKHKSFGLKSKELPPNLQIRMLLGEKNFWVESYAKLMQKD